MSTASIPLSPQMHATLLSPTVAVVCAAALLGLTLHFGNGPEHPAAPEALVSPGGAEVAGAQTQARSRCGSCGTVAAITRHEPTAARAAFYEFTVRLRDGSTRVSSMASPFTWKVGDKIMLLGGETRNP